MKIAIKEILFAHYKRTGEYVTQSSLAREMVKAGIFKNLHSAQNMIQYNITGKAKSLDIPILEFLINRFSTDDHKLTVNEIIL